MEQAKVNKDLKEQAALKKQKKDEEAGISLNRLVQDENSNLHECEDKDGDSDDSDDDFVHCLPLHFNVQLK